LSHFTLIHAFLVLLPKNLLSWVTGWLARLELPHSLQSWLNEAFAQIFRIDQKAAEKPIRSYKSIEDVFTRRLRPGLRPIMGELVSPADGKLARSGPVAKGQLIQAKGLHYSASELALGREQELDAAWFAKVYLAPHNYHRVHLPLSGEIVSVRYIPGQLWPVNLPYVLNFPRLFARNERLVFDFRRPEGNFWVVMVGALNVGRMTSELIPGFVTNADPLELSSAPREFPFEAGKKLQAGDELGVFMLGSTVVLILDSGVAKALSPAPSEGFTPILMGQSLL